MSLPSELKDHLEELLKQKIIGSSNCSGGCINQAALLTLEDSSRAFVKWNSSLPASMFQAEATGLRALRATSTIKIPAILGTGGEPVPFLALEGIALAAPGEWYQCGEQLAALHTSKSARFGFEQDNFIGALPQKNDWHSSWGEFFYQQRLLEQARQGEQRGWFDSSLNNLLKRAEKTVLSKLNSIDAEPVLLHGDLWSGNVIWDSEGAVLIDPATYYGDYEADLAMTEMFGRFPEQFYKGYYSVNPKRKGYESRKQILNLYHCMTHSNLFGGGYISSVRSTLKKLCGS